MVRLKGITKGFSGVIANHDIDFDLVSGEIHALLGENGAGKSTLMNILTGIYQPESGEIVIGDTPVAFNSPSAAIAAGIGMVHQHFKLVEAFTVAENIHLGWKDTPYRITRSRLQARTTRLAESLDLPVNPSARICDLSIGERQRVEILRVLSRKTSVLILDEPTAVLTPDEASALFKAIRQFVASGNAVVFISHKLDEVLEISHRVTVLRGGRKVATLPTAACDKSSLARLMVDQEPVLGHTQGGREARSISNHKVLSLREVSAFDNLGNLALRGVSLDLRAGEVLGIAGVAGNGQKELSEVLTGIRPVVSGTIIVCDQDLSSKGAKDFTAAGVGHIPEDRLHVGLAAALSVTDNAVVREYQKPPVTRNWIYRPSAAAALARSIAEAASVTLPDVTTPIRNLSGGNQQRLIVRREIRIASRILVAAYPCRGLDVGAINAVLRYFDTLRESGIGIIFVSEDLEELLHVSDRIGVMFRGELQGVVDANTADLETIGLMMGGQSGTPSFIRAEG